MDSSNTDFAACTIIAKHQLSKARALAQSWSSHHSGARFFALVIDPGRGFFRLELESFIVVTLPQLGLAGIEDRLFRHPFPAITSQLQPQFLSHLLKNENVGRLLYLSADAFVLGSLLEVAEILSSSNVLLSPFLTKPAGDTDCAVAVADVLAAGPYNSDFLGLRKSATTLEFLEWWNEKLEQAGFQSSEAASAVGQWLSLVPSLFGGISIIRQPGLHAGFWNYHEIRNEIALADRGPLENRIRVFHFRELDALEPGDLSKAGCAPIHDETGALTELLARYQQSLIANDWETTTGWTYGYDFYQNGQKISLAARDQYRSEHLDAPAGFDPFAALGKRRPGLDVTPDSHLGTGNAQFGINVLGHLTSEKGVGEMGRSNLRILHAAGIPCVANDFVDHGAHNIEQRPDTYCVTNPYPVNLISVNADCLTQYVTDNPSYLDNRLNIAYWAWELSEFPDEWATSFGFVDEVWTLSEFARDSIAGSSPVPVHAVHCSLDIDYEPEVLYRREDFEIPEDIFVFLYFFDFHSYIERKNPVGLVKAFKSAFGLRTDVQLLIKSSHSRQHLDQLQLLKEVAAGANVRVLDEVLSRDAKQGLMNAADCYVSLHRSEGFGLTIAEAMLCSKPTIATDYSGNRDFMTADTNYPVPYRLITIDRDHGPYRIGQQWADPDLDYAADVMRHIERHRSEAALLGQRAKAHVSDVLHPATIGRKVRRRLADLGVFHDDQSNPDK
jgi:glycosyltransferase involved in cell wall biosynthesis